MLKIVKKFFFTLTLRQGVFLIRGEEHGVHSAKLGQTAGVSTRTLRYYDEIGILKTARINSSGYRIYGYTPRSKPEIPPVNWRKKQPIFIVNGSAIFGTVTAKKPMPA